MRRERLITIAILTAAFALWTVPGAAVLADPTATPATVERAAGGAALPAVGDPNAGAVNDDLERLLEGLSPADVQQLVRKAIQARLEVERQQVAGEIKEGLLYEPDDIDAACKILKDKPANTQKDNIDRILRAFAKVDLRFGKAHKLLEARKYPQAAEAIKRDLNVQDATYLNAARYTVYARALAAADKGYDAVEAYQDLLVNMPDRISFAAAAALHSARIYENLKRFKYAGDMYRYAVLNYGLTLDAGELDAISKRLEKYAEFSRDPLGWAEGMMGQVKTRLDATDSGRETQQKEEQIVAVITDLIKTAEERQCGSCQSQQKRQQGRCPNCGKKGCNGQCQGSGQGKGQGPPKGTRQPSSPAQISSLVPGAVERLTKRTKIRDTSESGDWASLPPRERQRLEQLRKKLMSERYRDIIRDYRTRVAESSSP